MGNKVKKNNDRAGKRERYESNMRKLTRRERQESDTEMQEKVFFLHFNGS